MTTVQKPPYRVPSMAEINVLPWNNRNVVSCFSGAGGSCLGYRMAGYRVLWANEFIPAAAATYRTNHPTSILDIRDIRTVQPKEILQAIGMKMGELDLFDGSPPCASFSTAGSREKAWGDVKAYSGTKQRTDDLFFEYTRLLQGLQPKVFVAENVSGLVKGTAKGYFLQILAALKACGYRVQARLLDAQWLGVPQARQRVIFQGVRGDLGLDPVYPTPLAFRYTLTDALANVPPGEFYPLPAGKMCLLWQETRPGDNFSIVYQRRYGKPSMFCHRRLAWNEPAFSAKSNAMDLYHPDLPRSLSIPELKRICAFPDDFVLTGSTPQQWERLGRSVPPVMMASIAQTIAERVLS